MYRLLLCLHLFLALILHKPSHDQSHHQHLTFLRGGDIISLDVVSNTEQLILANANPTSQGAVWSPNGSMITFQPEGVHSHGLYIVDMTSDATYEIDIASNSMAAASTSQYSWSPDSRWIAYRVNYYDLDLETENYAAYVVEASNGAHPRLIYQGFTSTLQWMPDSHEVVYRSEDGHYRFNIFTGSTDQLLLPHFEYESWSSDGMYASVQLNPLNIGENAELRIYNTETGEMRSLANAYQILYNHFSPDGHWIAYEWDNRWWGERISVVNLATERNVDIAGAEFGEIDYWIWSPDSTMITYTIPIRIADKRRTELRVVNIETGEDRLITEDGHYYLTWSPDTQWIAYQSGSSLFAQHLQDGTVREITDIERVIGWRPEGIKP